jgi:uncharacterized protein (TIGR00369 family)
MTLAPDETFTTISLSIEFFRLVWHADLRAEARVVNRGRTNGYLECGMADQLGKAVAKVRSTCFVRRGEAAKDG